MPGVKKQAEDITQLSKEREVKEVNSSTKKKYAEICKYGCRFSGDT